MAACNVFVHDTIILRFYTDNEFSMYPNLEHQTSENPCYYVSLDKVNRKAF